MFTSLKDISDALKIAFLPEELEYSPMLLNIYNGEYLFDPLHLEDPIILDNLGCYYSEIVNNYEAAKEVLSLAGDIGYKQSIHNLAYIYYKEGDINQCVNNLIKGVQLGDATSFEELVGYYYKNSQFDKLEELIVGTNDNFFYLAEVY